MATGWLLAFDTSDRVAMLERASLEHALHTRAEAIDPWNPRVLWGKAAFLLFDPLGPKVAEAVAV